MMATAVDYVGPAIGAVLFVLGMSLVAESHRKTINAFLAVGVYISGGFGVWEVLFAALAMPIAYRGLRDYRFIALAWFVHAAWDLPHHLAGRPIWPFQANSSLDCMIFDSLIALWFLANAPPLVRATQAIDVTSGSR